MNIKDIARLANVSKSTVSRVINNDPNVSKRTREQVLKVIENQSFLLNYVAKSLKTKKTRTIGVLVPDIGNPFYYEILRGIEKVLDRYDFNMMFCNSEYDPKKELKYISLLASKKVDGIIMAPSSEMSVAVKLLLDREIPFVLLDILQKKYKTNCILVNHADVSYIATTYLYKCGHREIIALDAIRTSGIESSFIEGYRAAMKEFDLPVNQEFIQQVTPDIQGGYRAIKKIIASRVSFTAAIAICDLVAVGIYKATKELGLKIPSDISVIGNDDIPLSKYLNPPLTTIQQPKYTLGLKSAEILLDYIQNSSFSKENVKVIELQTRLIIRDSVSKKGAKN